MNENTLKKHLAFWQEVLEGSPETHSLKCATPEQLKNQGAAKLTSYLSLNTSRQLTMLCKDKDVSPFMLCHAAFSILLARQSGIDDVVIGTAVANRLTSQLEHLIGFFVNSVVLRTQYQADLSFNAYLDYIRDVNLQAQAHQDVPFEKVVGHCATNKTQQRSPIFQIMLSMNTNESQPVSIEGVEITPLLEAEPSLKFDLKLEVAVINEGWQFVWTYDQAYFCQATIAIFDNHLQQLFDNIVANPEQLLHKLELFNANTLRANLSCSPLTAFNESHYHSLIELFHNQVERQPKAVAMLHRSAQLTYKQLNIAANKLANHLVSRLPQNCQYIGICLARSFDVVVTMLAIWKIGKAYVPVHPDTPSNLVDYIVNTADLPLVVTTADLSQSVLEQIDNTLNIDSERAEIETQPEHFVAEAKHQCTDIAYVIFTSGSTGLPKGVEVGHGGLINLAYSIQQLNVSKPSKAWGWTASYSFDSSVKGLTQMLLGQPLAIIDDEDKLDAERVCQLVTKLDIGVLDCTPSLLEIWRESPLEYLPNLIIGGENISKSLWIELVSRQQAHPTLKAFNVYGPTECSVNSTWTEIKGAQPNIGKAIPNTFTLVLDKYDNLVPDGGVGELVIGGVGLARGYLKDDEKTAEKFIESPFYPAHPAKRLYRTGDIVRRFKDGTIEFLCREDNQVKVRGYRIELDEIIQQIESCEGVQSSLVMVAGQESQKRIVAYIQFAKEDEQTLTKLESIQSQIESKLQPYMLPSSYAEVAQWPLTINGKIDKNKLPEPKVFVSHDQVVKPSTEGELKLAAIWVELLELPCDSVCVNKSFFELGGHSLLIVRLVAEVRKKLAKEISIKDVYRHLTLKAMALYLEQLSNNTQVLIPPLERNQDAYPVSFTQNRLWFLDRMAGGSAEYNMPMAFNVSGAFCVETATQAMNIVIQRHESLRTVFKDIEGEPLQVLLSDWYFNIPQTDLSQQQEAQSTLLEKLIHASNTYCFDLTSELMVRAHYVKLNDFSEEVNGVLLFNMHHIASDGWSINVLIEEFSHLYSHLIMGKAHTLDALPVQYIDFASWQRDSFESAAGKNQLAYWRSHLDGVPWVHGLQLDKPRPEAKQYHGDKIVQIIEQHTAAGLREIANHFEITPFMVVHGALAIVLARHSGQSDIVVGTPIANRRYAELETLIGFFSNTLVLRISTDFESLGQFLEHVRDIHIAAQDNQDIPFEQLVDKLGVPRTLAYTPLFQILLTTDMQVERQVTRRELNLPNTELQLRESHDAIAKFDLHIAFSLKEKGSAISWIYDSSIFTPQHIKQLSQHLSSVLGLLANFSEHNKLDNQNLPLANLTMLSHEERQALQIIDDPIVSPIAHVHEFVTLQARHNPINLALSDAGSSLTYLQLEQRSNQYAHLLYSQGIKKGALVGVCMGRNIETTLVILGILKTGAAYVPLDSNTPLARIQYIIENTKLALLICDKQTITDLLPLNYTNLMHINSLEVQSQIQAATNQTLGIEAGSVADTAYVIYTSGSTGKPKGVVQSHGTIVNLVHSGIVQEHIAKRYKTLQYTSFAFDVSIQEMATSWATGSELYVLSESEKQSLHQLPAVLLKQQIERVFMPPAVLQIVAEQVLYQGLKLPELKEVIVAGEALKLSKEIRTFFSEHTSSVLWNHYGPTETHVVTTELVDVTQGSMLPAIGRVVPNNRLYVLDKQRARVPFGCIGELYVAGAGVAKGYLNQEELSAASFIQGAAHLAESGALYKTGDLVRYQADGKLEFIGRADHQVKIRGFRIEPKEIESVLNAHSKVDSCLVVVAGEQDKRLVAYVVTGESSDELNDELATQLAEQLPYYSQPSEIVMLSEWPLTINGKIDVAKLPEGAKKSEEEYIAAETATEKQLVAIWSELLGLEVAQISMRANFFELGGHSLLYMRLVAKINAQFNIKINIEEVFSVTSCCELADYISDCILKQNTQMSESYQIEENEVEFNI
ncbi:amino acid adenylation domain-containing protein [Shewanella sp.]|uniref:amino acid adenylation domain-containing protein n=1 Tax=Shewanella sp. TaxID=50422 RepID=UPI004053E30A